MQPVPYERSAVSDLVRVVTRTDGHAPLSGHKLEAIGEARSRTGVWSDGRGVCVVGVAAHHESNDHWAVEVVTAPEHRDPQQEEAAVRLAVGLVPSTAAHTVWAFRPAQIEAVERLGYREARAVLRVTGPIPPVTTSERSGVTFSTMEAGDVERILAVNNRAFPGHREQGAMSEQSFALLTNQPWFEPAGVLVAKAGDRVIGFCITKCEDGENGEILVIAVDPVNQHSGIGRRLIESSLDVLRTCGARNVTVWVDASNTAALRLYASLGLVEDFRTREFTFL